VDEDDSSPLHEEVEHPSVEFPDVAKLEKVISHWL
jgi:hypothetical protein